MGDLPSIPGYALLERIRGAGAATVYRAREEESQEPCIVSVLQGGASEREEQLQGFIDEGELLLEVRHPNVVRTLDVGSSEACAWIVQEDVSGSSLGELLERQPGPLSLEATLAIGVQLGRALAALAVKDVVHRDLNPQNVLLGGDGSARVTGFGLNVESSYDRLSSGQAPIGSVDYLSPEQVEGDLPPSPKTDVYALGALLYRCLAGRVPHAGATLFSRLRGIAHDAPVDLRELNPQVADEVARLIGRFMEWDADDRPLSLDTVVFLERLAAEVGISDPGWEREAVAALVERLAPKVPETRAAPDAPILVRLRGTDRSIERALRVGESFDIGRGHDCAVSLAFGWISRRHARIERRRHDVVLEDLGSANGTLINKRKIDGVVALEAGDLITMGKSRFEVSLQTVVEEATRPLCRLCGQDLGDTPAEEVCARCRERAEVDRNAASDRIRAAIEQSRFSIVEPVGSGGLFKRFRVKRRKKAFLVSATELGPRAAKLFSEGSKRALELSHPALLPVVDLEVHDGVLIVVDESHPGQTLEDLVAGHGPISSGETADVGQTLCAAADYLLEQGVRHVLFRPDLVLVGKDGEPVLLDAGLAPGLVEASRTRAGLGVQPCYCAPEVEDVRAMTPQALVYSLGATLSYALTGSPVAELRDGQRLDHLPLTMVATIPLPLAQLLARATALQPADRPQSPAELGIELARLVLATDPGLESAISDLEKTQRHDLDKLFEYD